jgi:hypothetical protein
MMKRFLRCWNWLGILHPSIRGGEISKSFVIFKRCPKNECTADTARVNSLGIRVVLDPRTTTCLRRLAASFSQQRLSSNLRQSVLDFVVDNLELELIFLHVFQPFFSVSAHQCLIFFNSSIYSFIPAIDQKHLESFEMWCWRRMEKISWTDHARNEHVLFRVKEQRNILT